MISLRPRGIAVVARTLTALSLVALIATGAACKREEKGPLPSAAQAAAPEPPVPAPAGLLADVIVPTPQQTWGRVQRGVGGALGIMPSTVGGMVCAFSGIDPTLGPEIDGSAPLFVVVAGDPVSPAFAIAVKLTDRRRARLALVESETARFAARDLAGMTELTPRGGGGAPVAIALTGDGHLVLARTSADLERLGPYAYRTLPTRPMPEVGAQIDVPGEALRGALHDALARAWNATKAGLLEQDAALRAKHGGRAPDFGDPSAILASLDAVVQARLAAIGDLRQARLAVEASDDALRGDLVLSPNDGDGPAHALVAGMHPGDMTPLLAAPLSSPVAIAFHDDASARASDAAALEAGLVKALGPRLREADAKTLHAALDDWAKGRGDSLAAALAWDGGRGLVVRGTAASPELLGRAVREGLELTRAPALREPLKSLLRVRDVSFSAIDLPRESSDAEAGAHAKGEKAELATLSFEPMGPKLPAPKVGVGWTTAGGALHLAVAEDAPALLARAPGRTLADDPILASAGARLGSDASMAILVQPLRFDAARASAPAAPLVIGWGRRAGDAWLHLDAADVLVRDFVRSQAGL